jgi:hypothetical protein
MFWIPYFCFAKYTLLRKYYSFGCGLSHPPAWEKTGGLDTVHLL